MSSKKLPVRFAITAAIAALCLAVAPAALAAKGGGGGPKPSGGSGSLSLVLLNSADGLPHWGQDVTFEASTTATTRPMVSLTCTQGGTLVYSAGAGLYDGYPWSKVLTLASSMWAGGAASCTARLYYSGSNGREITLGTTSIYVYA